MKQFILLLHEQAGLFKQYSPNELQEIIEEYGRWAHALAEKNNFAGGHQLDSQRHVLKNENGKIIMDGPFTESKEVIGGYFVILASDADEAVAISRQCPHLKYGGRVEVRELLSNNN